MPNQPRRSWLLGLLTAMVAAALAYITQKPV